MSAERPGTRPPLPASAETAAAHPWRSVVAFVAIVGALVVVLRLLHLVVPLFYPPVLAGPFSLDDFAEVERYTGFEPLLPFYRPEVLGRDPVNVTVRRQPRPEMVAFWLGERLLYLAETRGGPRPYVGPEARPLPDHPGTLWWREGRTLRLVLERDGLWVEMRTDLPQEDLHRLVATLRPYSELL